MARKVERIAFEMDAEDYRHLGHLPYGFMGIAYEFWMGLGHKMKFDYRTVLPIPGRGRRHFSALPLNHKKYWCWPLTLKCSTPVAHV